MTMEACYLLGSTPYFNSHAAQATHTTFPDPLPSSSDCSCTHCPPRPPRSDPTECRRFIYYAIDAALRMADPQLNPEARTIGIVSVQDFGWANFDLVGGISVAKAVHVSAGRGRGDVAARVVVVCVRAVRRRAIVDRSWNRDLDL